MKPELTQEYIKTLLDYDKETGVFIWKERKDTLWNNRYAGMVAGGPSSDGYTRISVNNVRYKAHRLAYLYEHGYMPKYIDHIDHDGKNNRIVNLRDVTHQKNHQNQKKNKNNTSGVTGVVFRNDTKNGQLR